MHVIAEVVDSASHPPEVPPARAPPTSGRLGARRRRGRSTTDQRGPRLQHPGSPSRSPARSVGGQSPAGQSQRGRESGTGSCRRPSPLPAARQAAEAQVSSRTSRAALPTLISGSDQGRRRRRGSSRLWHQGHEDRSARPSEKRLSSQAGTPLIDVHAGHHGRRARRAATTRPITPSPRREVMETVRPRAARICRNSTAVRVQGAARTPTRSAPASGRRPPAPRP